MPSFTSILFFVLGVFEFVAVAGLLFESDAVSIGKNQLYPSYFITDFRTKILLCTWLMTLAFQRLSWASGNRNFGAWLCVVGTHMTEAIFLWSLALLPTFNKANLPPIEFLKALVQLEAADPFSTFVLLFVPLLVAYLTLGGPGGEKKKAKKN
jgi:hypothetical protein